MKKFIGTLAIAILLTGTFLVPSLILASSDYYINSSGSKIHVPVKTVTIPIGATARCRDGSYSYSQHRSGTCSSHKGVANWLR